MSATTSQTPGKPDIDELVQQLDFLTADVNRIERTLRHIRVATIITAIASALTILAFLFWFLLALVGLSLTL
ncbi:MAG TPA: hypothetical protein VE972_05895 [Conexibacter sp.]|nr:hypothetical protein [Conexibacter sp.]